MISHCDECANCANSGVKKDGERERESERRKKRADECHYHVRALWLALQLN